MSTVEARMPQDAAAVSARPTGPGSNATARTIWLLVDTRSVGGIERHVATLAAYLLAQAIPVEVVIYADHGGNNPWLAQLGDLGVPYRFLDGSLRGLWNAVRLHRPALIHTHGYKANILGRLIAQAARVPVVSTYHSGEKAKLPVGAYYALDDWTAWMGQAIAVSKPIQKRLPFAATHIPNFVALAPKPAANALPATIGFVGRLSHEKAPDLFCEIARASPPGIGWHVYGDGPMRAELERNHGDLITFHGIASRMDAVWPKLGALLMPSRFEGLPLAALEALSFGVPVLASQVGGVPTVVDPGRTGWLFEVGDIPAAVEAVQAWAALSLTQQHQMRAQAWDHVRVHFSADAHVPQILSVYARAGFKSQSQRAARSGSGTGGA